MTTLWIHMWGPRTRHYGSPAGNSPGSVPLHPPHRRLHLPLTLLSHAEVLWSLCDCRVSSLTRTTGNTEDWCRTLWTGASGTASRSLWGKLENCLISAGADTPRTSVNIQGMDIELVTSYKYLGVHLNNKLDWTDHASEHFKKVQSRLYLLRRLRPFGVQGALLKTFYDSVVASAIFFWVVWWGSSISSADRKRLDRLNRRDSLVLGYQLDSVEIVGQRRMMAKLSSLMDNQSHPPAWRRGIAEHSFLQQ